MKFDFEQWWDHYTSCVRIMDSERREIAEQAFQAGCLITQSETTVEVDEHMLDVAKANGFTCLTDAIVAVKKAHAMLERIACPRRGSKDESATLQKFADEIQAGWPLAYLSNITMSCTAPKEKL